MENKFDKKSFLLILGGYVFWGLQPLYWKTIGATSAMFNLSCRIIWAMIFTVGLLAATKRLPEIKALFKNKEKMKFIVPAAILLLLDWGVFIYAVQAGHVLDTSLGYYMGPFVVFALGMLVFKEKPAPLTLVAMGLAVVGVAASVIYYGQFPILAVALAFLFSVYGALKKFAQVDSLLSIAVETIIMVPFALAYLIFVGTGEPGGMGELSVGYHLLLVGSGIVTALPMVLYSLGVLKLPFVMLGFMQYISPTLSMICGLFLGEQITPDKLVTFIFIWAGLILYSITVVREEKKKRLMAKNE
ncbi:EamA family transporter RarD [Eubacteriales bacterium OttesenSCG-928-K08]|nr:EamA family transporter RarD [Eubacteriales bacterium OttesenSCG-928-K08]